MEVNTKEEEDVIKTRWLFVEYAVFSISGNVYKQEEMEIGKLIYDV